MDSYDPDKTTKQTVSERYDNADVYIGDINDKKINLFSGSKDFGILLSSEASTILRSGHDTDKERLLHLLDDSVRSLSDLREKLTEDNALNKFRLGISVGAGNQISFLANDGDKTLFAGAIDDLLNSITESKE